MLHNYLNDAINSLILALARLYIEGGEMARTPLYQEKTEPAPCKDSELAKIAGHAVRDVLEIEKRDVFKYEYRCISVLDTLALNAMRAVGQSSNREYYFKIARAAVAKYLEEHPGFLKEQTVSQPRAVRSSGAAR